jgi:transposase
MEESSPISQNQKEGHYRRDTVLPENIRLLPLPPYSPELNPMENVWEYLRQNELAFLVWETY